MRRPTFTGQFKRDVKRQEKRGRDMAKLKALIALLIDGQTWPRELGDHALRGEWKPSRDLHIEPDWLLIYCVVEDVVRFERTGTHADLFGS